MLMEEILEEWNGRRSTPIQAEGFIHFAALDALEQAALSTAKRLKLNDRKRGLW